MLLNFVFSSTLTHSSVIRIKCAVRHKRLVENEFISPPACRRYAMLRELLPILYLTAQKQWEFSTILPTCCPYWDRKQCFQI